MNNEKSENHHQWLIKTYFSDPARWLTVKEGDVLMHQSHYNNRLYYVRSGKFQGYYQSESGIQKDALRAGPGNFLGVYSFFSHTYKSMATVVALTDGEVAYIDRNQRVVETDYTHSLEEQFMPVVVEDLMRRQHSMLALNAEREQALTKLIETEKMASLGQLAAGIAHELNNAISVLARNTQWLVEKYNTFFENPRTTAIFEAGLMQGRFLSSREVRLRSKELMERFNLPRETASMLAQTGLDDEIFKNYGDKLPEEAQTICTTWELGATFNDMLIAAEQSKHVVKSIRSLGAKQVNRQPGMDIVESINSALALLRTRLKGVEVHLDLNPLPPIHGNMGEFVQVWVNLINNAYEAMCHLVNHQPILWIASKYENQTIIVSVRDNGLGIPKKLLPLIFQPNVTTKVHGLSFGLGLGLTIVQRIINDYNGIIEVESSREGTTFIIKIPVGGIHEKA